MFLFSGYFLNINILFHFRSRGRVACDVNWEQCRRTEPLRVFLSFLTSKAKAFLCFLVLYKIHKTIVLKSHPGSCTSVHKGDLHMPKRGVRDSVSWLHQRLKSAIFFLILTKFLHAEDHRNKICEFCFKINQPFDRTHWADVETRVPFTYKEIKPSNVSHTVFIMIFNCCLNLVKGMNTNRPSQVRSGDYLTLFSLIKSPNLLCSLNP